MALPQTFHIGVDATAAHLAEYSAKVSKKPSRGGLPNALYVVADAASLPAEMGSLASAITINFPWSSLLAGLLAPAPALLSSIASIAKPDARLDIYINTLAFT
jgi:16S rRNA (adenine(1408)-N(1))-methyltransferase